MGMNENSGDSEEKKDEGKMSDLFTVMTEEEYAQKKDAPEEEATIDDIDEELLKSILSAEKTDEADLEEIDEDLLNSILSDDALMKVEEATVTEEMQIVENATVTEETETVGETVVIEESETAEKAESNNVEESQMFEAVESVEAVEAVETVEAVEETQKDEAIEAAETGKVIEETELLGTLEEAITVEEITAEEIQPESVPDLAEPEDKTSNEQILSESETVTVITKGTTINGSIASDCPLDVVGTINGDIECRGKLTISGKVVGNARASEVFVNTERFEGNINSEGCVKVSLETIIVGNIVATSAVIAGAVKGDVDVNGTVVIDSTAIIKGNIKAKSVQMNNGAVVEGFCSLSYATVEIDKIFE